MERSALNAQISDVKRGQYLGFFLSFILILSGVAIAIWANPVAGAAVSSVGVLSGIAQIIKAFMPQK